MLIIMFIHPSNSYTPISQKIMETEDCKYKSCVEEGKLTEFLMLLYACKILTSIIVKVWRKYRLMLVIFVLVRRTWENC